MQKNKQNAATTDTTTVLTPHKNQGRKDHNIKNITVTAMTENVRGFDLKVVLEYIG